MKTDEEDNELYDRDPQVSRVVCVEWQEFFIWWRGMFFCHFRQHLFCVEWQCTIGLSLAGKTRFVFH